ncbi:uncharacterized LOC101736846 [Bombyx mori]|uniref:RS-rich protein n=1 Tax=Bombyx mori TaxID=7091 RepID=A0A0B5JC11_BOMMO|nr:uncharacterized LOC101736846 [Bombyx mori]AJF98576.1 RS-rich protein [Bombyx mori]
MGKVPYLSDSEATDDTCSSYENGSRKKKFSILKCTTGNIKKKKCKVHSKSEPDDSDYRSRTRSRSRSGNRVRYKLPGILKRDKDGASSDDDEESEVLRPKSQDRCLVGRVPRPAGAKPGRGGGVAIVVKRNVSNRFPSLQPQASTSIPKHKRSSRRQLSKKLSY